MQFKQYPSYKNSGVEWLGEVPEHWTVLKNRHIFNFSKGLSITKENLQESGIPCVSYGEVHSKFGFEFNPEINDLKFVSEEYLKTSKNCLLNSGDFIFADTSEDFEGSGNFSYLNSKSQVFAGYHTVIARLKFSHNPRFFAYVFDSNAHRKQIQTQVKGIKVFSITQGILKDIYSWLPPIDEQQKIVLFLDTETARIDNLISKQEKLIELLEEQRKSIISHAVTKGLNPNAPMKDSGVEWLGKVPNDWNFSRLDAVSKIVRGNSAFSKMDLLESGKYVALQYGKTYKVNEINESFGSYVNQEFFKKSQITEFGDIILISTSETLEDLGHSCFYARHDVGLIGGEQFLLKPKNQNFGKYIYYATKAFSSYLQRYATGLKVFRFNLDDLKKIYIPDISLVEQQKIAEFLDKETARIDISVLKQKSLIEKLKEYRASIISHAVTGKIDVREFGA